MNLKTKEQFHQSELVETRRIASLHVHIERTIGRVKAYQIPNNIPWQDLHPNIWCMFYVY